MPENQEQQQSEGPKQDGLSVLLHKVTDTKHRMMYFSGFFTIALLFLDFYFNQFRK